MALDRVKITSKGFSGANGYNNFYFTAMTSANMTAINNLLTALRSFIPITVTYSFPTTGDTIDEKTGKIIGGWSVGSAPADNAMTAGLSYSAPTGFLIEWRCGGTVVDGHRPIGKSFFVPGAQAVFNGQGGILSSASTSITAAALSFLSASSGFSVWHRPKFTGKGPTRVQVRDGAIVPVISGICGPKAVVLRSRRD